MAEEEIAVAPAASPAPRDYKRKLENVEPEAPERDPSAAGSDAEANEVIRNDDVALSDSSHAKRPRLIEKIDDLGVQENGSQAGKPEKHHEEEKHVETEEPDEENGKAHGGASPTGEVDESNQAGNINTKTVDPKEHSLDGQKTEDNQQASVKDGSEAINTQEPASDVKDGSEAINAHEPANDIKDGSEAINTQEPTIEETKDMNDKIPRQEVNETQSTSRKIEVSSSKVGVLIGKGGDTIRYLQYNSGARIQILKDAEADPNSSMRPVEIIGSLASIEKAEKLIHAVIAEADAGGSPSLIARGLAIIQAAGGVEQIEMQVPNNKVGLIIGRGGETIKHMQTKSGARIQLIPQHQEGDGSRERTVRVSGDKKQIEMATEMIKDAMNQIVRPSPFSVGYNQPGYRPRGPAGPPQWGSRGPHAAQSMPYDHHHHHHHGGPYPSQSPHYQPPSYGGYPPQNMPPRSSFGGGWDQRPPHSGSHDYYGRQRSQISAPHSTPASGHAPGPLPSPSMGPPLSQGNYSYGQSHGPEYGHAPPPYSQTGPQQSYGHMYEQQPPPMQQPYGGHGGSQPNYQQAGGQPGYGQPQQHVKPYVMQGTIPQPSGLPRPAAPGDMPYQGVAPQQQYPYGSSGPMQQSYPSYGSVAPASDGYGQQAPPSTAPGYQQPGPLPVSAYGQPSGQQATTGYGQVASSGGYATYPSSQHAYTEQPAQNSGSYGYQGFQDPSYGSTYGAASSGQPAYSQAAPAQPGYEQSATQSGGYGGAPGTAPGKSVSPQPGYPQYDTNQVYGAPR